MSNRTPFEQLPPGCPPLDFDVDIVPQDFLFCTNPPVTAVTMRPMTFNIDTDIVAAPFCPCIPTLAAQPSKPTVYKAGTVKPVLAITMWNATKDCCEPKLTMHIDLGIPCMPLNITGTATSTIKKDDKKLSFRVALTKRAETCELTYSLDLKIPCMPLNVTGTTTSTIKKDDNKLSLKLELTKRAETCELTYSLDLKIPCMPLDITGTATSTIKLDDKRLSFRVALTKRSETCELTYRMDLKIPCMPLNITGTSTSTIKLNDPELSFKVELTRRTDTCAITYNMNLKIPCMPLTFTKTGTAYIKPSMKITAFITMDRMGNTCGMTMYYKFAIPCMPLTVSNYFKGTVIFNLDRPQLNPALQNKVMHRIESPTCHLKFDMDLQVPCLPKSITMPNAPSIIYSESPGPSELKFQRMPTCKFQVNMKLNMACMPFDVEVDPPSPEFVPYGNETVALQVEKEGCNLKFKVNLMAVYWNGCFTHVQKLEWEPPYLKQYLVECCYTNGRLLSVKPPVVVNVLRAAEC